MTSHHQSRLFEVATSEMLINFLYCHPKVNVSFFILVTTFAVLNLEILFIIAALVFLNRVTPRFHELVLSFHEIHKETGLAGIIFIRRLTAECFKEKFLVHMPIEKTIYHFGVADNRHYVPSGNRSEIEKTLKTSQLVM